MPAIGRKSSESPEEDCSVSSNNNNMGIESFSVILRAVRSEPLKSVRGALATYPHLKLLGEYNSEVLYEYADDECIIETSLRGADKEAEFDLCVRFALSNPDSVEQRFIDFVKWVGCRWHPQLWQMSSVSKAKTVFASNELDDFVQRAPSEIRALRAVWQEAFGSKRGAVRVEDVYRWLADNGGPAKR